MDWDDASKLLRQKLDPSKVRKPSGNFGPKGDYIEGWHAIDEANRIFGFGSWSYTITTLTQDSLKEAEKNGRTQWQAAYTCIVRVEVGDVVREDVGFGSGFAAQIGDAIEGATKEAVTDALKRALRTFGNPFGLALYDKSRENVGAPEPEGKKERDPEQVTSSLLSAIARCDSWAALEKVRKGNNFSAAYSWLQAEHNGHWQTVKDALDGKARAFDPAMQAPDLAGSDA